MRRGVFKISTQAWHNQSIKILLVEDEEIPRKVIKLLLSELGCKVEVASTGIEAFNRLQTELYDLILMDIGLPDIDGLNVAKRVREQDGPNSNMPIIILSAYSATKYKEQAKAIGAHCFITKPVTSEMCEELLRSFTKFKAAC